jgi:hypothetical protein
VSGTTWRIGVRLASCDAKVDPVGVLQRDVVRHVAFRSDLASSTSSAVRSFVPANTRRCSKYETAPG